MSKRKKSTTTELAETLANGISTHPVGKLPPKKAEKKQKAKKPSKKAQEPAPKPVPEPEPQPPPPPVAPSPPPKPAGPPSLRDKLLAKAQTKAFDPSKLAHTLQEKQEVANEPALMAEFAKLVQAADQLGIDDMIFEFKPWEAQKRWFSLSLDEMMNSLRRIARQTEEASVQDLVANLNDYMSNHFVGKTFWGVIEEIVRPFSQVQNRGELQDELAKLVAKRLVERNPTRRDEEAVVLFFGTAKEVYAPVRQRNAQTQKWELASVLTKLGWQFVKEAAQRVRQETNQRFKDLKAMKARGNLTPKEALEQKPGKFFVMSGVTRGLLMESNGNGVRIVEAIDFPGKVPSEWMAWNAENCPWSQQAAFAFKTWRERMAKKLA